MAQWPPAGGLARYEELARRLEAESAPAMMRAHLDWQVGARLRSHGEAAEARSFLERREALYEGPNDALANMVRLRANLVRESGDWGAADALLARAGSVLSPPSDDVAPYAAQARAAWHDARFALYNEMGMLDAASAEVEAQTTFAARSKDPIAIANAFMNRATLAVSRQDWDAVDDLVAEAEAGKADLDARDRARLGLRQALSTAEAERQSRRPVGSSERMFRALIAAAGTPPDIVLEARTSLAATLFDRGLMADSVTESQVAEADVAREPASSPVARTCNVTLAALAARQALAAGPNRPDEAVLRSLRVRLLAEFERQIERYRRAPPETSGIGYLHFGDSYLLANELMRVEIALGRADAPAPNSTSGARAALEVPLRLHSVGSLARGTPARDLDLAGVERGLVASEGGFLLYFPGRARTLVFALDASGARVWELESWLAIELARREVQSAVLMAARSGTPEDERRAREVAAHLAGLVFPPELASRIAMWRSIVVLGTDLTGWIPFELLRPTAASAELGLTHAVSYLPSFHWGVFLDARPTEPIDVRGPDLLLVTGDRVPDEVARRWSVEDFTEDVVEPVLAAWGDRARHVARAAFDDVRNGAPSARVVQIVAHGVYDAHRRRPAGILFSGAGTQGHEAWPEDVESVRWPEIVVLDTCGSQRAQLRRGDDGRAGLGGAILAGGARCVLLSYSDVELRASMHLTSAFGRELRAGAAPAEALRRARSSPGVGFQGMLVHAFGRADRPVARPAVADGTTPHGAGSAEVPGVRVPLAVIGLAGAIAAGLIALVWSRRRART